MTLGLDGPGQKIKKLLFGRYLPRGTLFFSLILGSIFDGFCVEFLFAWPFVCLLLRSSARSTVAVHLRFSCVLRAYEPHRQSTIPT